MKHILVAMLVVLFAMGLQGQQTVQKNKPPSSSSQKADQKPSPKPAPTLGFNRAKDVSPVIDSDALIEEGDMQKKLPGNEFVKDKRALHEAGLMHEFVEGFTDSKECNGITLHKKRERAGLRSADYGQFSRPPEPRAGMGVDAQRHAEESIRRLGHPVLRQADRS